LVDYKVIMKVRGGYSLTLFLLHEMIFSFNERTNGWCSEKEMLVPMLVLVLVFVLVSLPVSEFRRKRGVHGGVSTRLLRCSR